MSARPEVLLAIALCALVTFLPRVLPMLFINKIALPAIVIAWLRLTPAAILVALLVPGLFFSSGKNLLDAAGIAVHLVACLGTIIAFFLSRRNFMVAFVAGVAVYALLINLLGHQAL